MKSSFHLFMVIDILGLIFLSIFAQTTGETFTAVFGGLGSAFITLLWIMSKGVIYARN